MNGISVRYSPTPSAPVSSSWGMSMRTPALMFMLTRIAIPGQGGQIAQRRETLLLTCPVSARLSWNDWRTFSPGRIKTLP